MVFLYDGDRVLPEHTPEQLGMEDMDEIVAAAVAGNPMMQQANDLMQVARNDPELLARMRRQGAADLAAAIEAGDLANVTAHLQRLMDQKMQAEAAARQAEIDLANADPFDPAAQARIAEQVRRGPESRTAREGARVVEAASSLED